MGRNNIYNIEKGDVIVSVAINSFSFKRKVIDVTSEYICFESYIIGFEEFNKFFEKYGIDIIKAK